MRREQRATILDVAALAGVHAATVSRTINVPEKVAPETRRRVEEAVRELGFVPNRAARGLITGRTGNVAVIVPDITNPHFASLVRSVERSARQSDLQVLLVDTGEHPDEEVRAAESLSREVDGFIIVSPRRLHRALGALGPTPAVFVNRPVREHASILLRTAPAVADALQHLAALGHTRVPTWVGRADRGRRASGGARCGAPAAPSGMEVVELTVAEPTFEATASSCRRSWPAACRPSSRSTTRWRSAWSPASPASASPFPDDISVVGFDDVPMAAMVAPPLTTISLPTSEVGAVAVAMLGEGPRRRSSSGELVVRHSTARAT